MTLHGQLQRHNEGGFICNGFAKLPEHQSYNLHMKKDERFI